MLRGNKLLIICYCIHLLYVYHLTKYWCGNGRKQFTSGLGHWHIILYITVGDSPTRGLHFDLSKYRRPLSGPRLYRTCQYKQLTRERRVSLPRWTHQNARTAHCSYPVRGSNITASAAQSTCDITTGELPSQVSTNSTHHSTVASRELDAALAAKATPSSRYKLSRSQHYRPLGSIPLRSFSGPPPAAEARQPLRRSPGAASDRRPATIRRPLDSSVVIAVRERAAVFTGVPQLHRAAQSSLLSASVPQSSPVFRNHIERPSLHFCQRACRSLHPLFILSRA
jgi:hypothetical protein